MQVESSGSAVPRLGYDVGRVNSAEACYFFDNRLGLGLICDSNIALRPGARWRFPSQSVVSPGEDDYSLVSGSGWKVDQTDLKLNIGWIPP